MNEPAGIDTAKVGATEIMPANLNLETGVSSVDPKFPVGP